MRIICAFIGIALFSIQSYADTYVKVIVQNKTNPYSFDIMLDKLYKANPANVSIVDDHKHMDQTSEEDLIDEAEDTMTILTKYIEKIEGCFSNVMGLSLPWLRKSLINEGIYK